VYKPLEIVTHSTAGVHFSLKAARLPHPNSESKGLANDLKLGAKLVKAGTDHAKFTRGIIAYVKFKCQIGWLIEYVTYRIGVECLSSSSAMHDELKLLKGVPLAEEKQNGLNEKVYVRAEMLSYQALRNIYLARRNHRHPDWHIFCDWIESLPYFEYLIYPEGREATVPDITKCTADDCPLKEHCYRWNAKPSPMNQSYSKFIYEDSGGIVNCEYFMPTREEL